MAKYQTLKKERDDAVARALEAERLSNKAEIEQRDVRIAALEQDLEVKEDALARAKAEASRLRGELQVVHTRVAQALGHRVSVEERASNGQD
jgi:chromosome segregation ATPase